MQPGTLPVKLLTMGGDVVVHNDHIPPFQVYPEVITFGHRVFMHHRFKKPDAAEWEYVEVFRYGLNP